MLLTSAWLGYDLSYNDIENHPQVKEWRVAGIDKRIKRPEHHLTVGYFDSVDSDQVVQTLVQLSSSYPKPLAHTALTLSGYGKLPTANGDYVYLTPEQTTEDQAWSIRQALLASSLLKENKDFHLSIGGPDPFSDSKPKQQELNPPLVLQGTLVLVGKAGTDFKKLFWNDQTHTFIESSEQQSSSPNTIRNSNKQPVTQQTQATKHAPIPVHTLAMFPKIQADTATAAYLLARFGHEAFPGIDTAEVIFWTSLPEGETAESLLAKGTLTIDLGGPFDHHIANQASGKREETASSLVAKYLGLADKKSFQKILAWAKRDDLEGKGTVSDDPLDRAFGLSGLMMNLNRAFTDNPKKTLDYILPLLHYHVVEEEKRSEQLPKEWDELQANGTAKILKLYQGSADLKVATLTSDNIALPGFLRAAKRMDMVVQRRSTNHTNIITRQERSIDLRPIIEGLRVAEAMKLGIPLSLDHQKLQAVGRVDEIPQWYYDDAANTIQNGGVNPGDTPATNLSFEEVIDIVQKAIPKGIIGSLKRQKAAGR